MSLYFTIAELASLENLALAARAARRGKSRRPDVDEYHRREESHLLCLREALLEGSWQPGEYREFIVHEPKRRLICAAPYADRVAHHALCLLLEPLLSRRFIARSFSCQKGKGTTAARECVRKLVNRHRYVLKCDIRKFFESIDHEFLLARLERAVHCPGVRRMMRLIVESHSTPDRDRPCGLPLGNLTSQIWANFFLDPLVRLRCRRQHDGAARRVEPTRETLPAIRPAEIGRAFGPLWIVCGPVTYGVAVGWYRAGPWPLRECAHPKPRAKGPAHTRPGQGPGDRSPDAGAKTKSERTARSEVALASSQ